ncbi:RNA-binding domain-containing protein [Teratosphaeria nubilosa]|uniref:Multiple RNA-binding domain-containing protein 1 n=1 Tax=Teratosphaeria nubilosa TaxID=161662 RepID=A0A6G1KY66_9PEZI|nr:RNA-binding domain-containing protein [Teratosphaeria nubilosa]
MAEGASSRIFVKGLPPTFSEAEFRKHFSQNRDITDAKIFSNRRIGYVGYRTSEDAQKAVKYFNKTFIRMSRIGVELARPVQDAKPATQAGKSSAPTVRKGSDGDGKPTNAGGLKRKRDGDVQADEAVDSKLKEFLDAYKPKSKKKAWENEDGFEVPEDSAAAEDVIAAKGGTAASDDEYEVVPRDAKRAKRDSKTQQNQDESDADDEPAKADATRRADNAAESIPLPPSEEHEHANNTPPSDNTNAVRNSMRLFIRNLPYDVKSEDLEAEFESYGSLEEATIVHVPLDHKTGQAKGFAYVQFADADAAENALKDRDGQTFQGRLLHILPATAKREAKLDDFELSKLPLKKQQQIRRRREAASATFNWNALYMNADAVVSSVADRLGISKSDVLDPTSSDAAVKQAHAETHIIQETKAYFKQQGVDLDAFKKSQRGDIAILVKNIPYDCSKDELKRLFEEHGEVKRFLIPPSGVIAVIEYDNAAQCKAAFGALAYRKVKSSILFLEKAPKNLFSATPDNASTSLAAPEGVNNTSASDLKDADYTLPKTSGNATLFVRNLNFSTSTQQLTETFKPLDGFMSGRVKTKTDPKKPGQVLSMGFGFLEFRSATQAQAALRAMDGYTLDGHKLQIRASHKGADAAEERRKADAAKKASSKRTKVIIKNLPFEATKKDVRSLFGAYGQLRSVRVPKKMDRGARGFAFADFTTPKEAESAMDALKDTHLLGRRLVLDFAAGEAEDAEAEIEKMQAKVGAQVNKVALQTLTNGGRKKFMTAQEVDE